MSKLTKSLPLPKPVGVVIRVVLIVIAALALVWVGLFIHAMVFTVDYRNAHSRMNANADEAFLEANSYEINLPFFGNSVLLRGSDEGTGYVVPFYLGELGELGLMNLMGSYDEINNTLDAYTWMLSDKYDGRAKLDYTVENKDGLLTVHFNGAGYNADGSVAENIDKEFVFDVKGASAFNFPEWVNRTPEDDYFANMEFLKA